MGLNELATLVHELEERLGQASGGVSPGLERPAAPGRRLPRRVDRLAASRPAASRDDRALLPDERDSPAGRVVA